MQRQITLFLSHLNEIVMLSYLMLTLYAEFQYFF